MRQTPVAIGKDFRVAFREIMILWVVTGLLSTSLVHIIAHEIAAHKVKILNRITLHFLIHS